MGRKKKSEVMKNTEKPHATLSMSAAHRWINCPGSVYLSSKCPPAPTSKYAEEGTLAHSVAESILTEVLIDQGNLFQSYHNHKDVCSDAEMQEHVLNYCLEVTKLMLSTRVQRLAVEKKFVLSEELDLGGIADIAFTCLSPAGKKVGCIVDLKYGQGTPVEVNDNPQLIGYACAMDATPEWGPLDRAVVYIYQPRCEHPDGVLRALKLTREELDTWKTRLIEAGKLCIKQAQNEEPEFHAGEHCQFCGAQATCLAFSRYMRGEAGVDFLPEVEPAELPEPIQLTDDQIRRAVLHRGEIESFLKRVEEYAMARALDGKCITGLKLVHGKGAGRRWAGKPDEVAAALVSRGVTEPWNHKLKGIGEVEGEIGKGKIDDLTLKPEAPLKIVSVDDKREAVLAVADQAVLDFTTVEGK
jgi:hypothetical protein